MLTLHIFSIHDATYCIVCNFVQYLHFEGANPTCIYIYKSVYVQSAKGLNNTDDEVYMEILTSVSSGCGVVVYMENQVHILLVDSSYTYSQIICAVSIRRAHSAKLTSGIVRGSYMIQVRFPCTRRRSCQWTIHFYIEN